MQIYHNLWTRKTHHRGRLVHLFIRKNQQSSYCDDNTSFGRPSQAKWRFRRINSNTSPKLKHHSVKHTDFKKSLKICNTRNFGRSIKAMESIAVGEVAMETKAFAAAVERMHTVRYCLTCHKMDVFLISCNKCSVVFFCNLACRNANLTHKFECGTDFHRISDLDLKCAIQMVFEAMATFDTFNRLNHFVQRAVKTREGIPKASNNRESRLDCILKLKPRMFKTEEEKGLAREIVLNAHRLMVNFPEVNKYFELDYKPEGGCFLEHFLAHNISVIMENGFRISLIGRQGECDRVLIYDVLSFLNHACSPNVFNLIEGNVMTCITSQRIQPGDQLFISYRAFGNASRLQRQHQLNHWDFVCQCIRCEYKRDINEAELMKAEKMNESDLKRKLDQIEEWTPQRGAYIMRYEDLLSVED